MLEPVDIREDLLVLIVASGASRQLRKSTFKPCELVLGTESHFGIAEGTISRDHELGVLGFLLLANPKIECVTFEQVDRLCSFKLLGKVMAFAARSSRVVPNKACHDCWPSI